MHTWTAAALHDIVSDARRRHPIRALKTTCPFCNTPGSVDRVIVDHLLDECGVEACRCDLCGREWLDHAAGA